MEQDGKIAVRVECYSGYKAEERPMRIVVGENALDVVDIEDRWYEPGATYFRLTVTGGDRYVLRHTEAQDTWELSAYRAAS